MTIKDFLKKRPLSWSSISCFEYDPEEWYNRYWLGKPNPPNPEMLFGKAFADSVEAGKPMAPVTVYNMVEQPFKVIFNGIPLIGFADTFCIDTWRKLGEFKTGKYKMTPDGKEPAWTQKRVDEHGQLTMYCFMHFISKKIRPEEMDIFLQWIPTEETPDFKLQLRQPVEVHTFRTKRTMADILAFGKRINNTVAAMQKYVDAKSTTE